MGIQAFIKRAKEAGFTEEQAEFLAEHVSQPGHSHDAEDIVDFQEAVEEITAEEEEEEAEDESDQED